MNCCHNAIHFTHLYFTNCYCRGLKKQLYNICTSSWFIIKCTVKSFIAAIFFKKKCTDVHKYNKVWLTCQFKHLLFCVCVHVCVRRHPETAVAGLQKTQSHPELRESPHTLPPEEMRHTSSDCVYAIQTDSSLRKRPKHHFTSVNAQ